MQPAASAQGPSMSEGRDEAAATAWALAGLASSLCHHNFPMLSKTLWARLQRPVLSLCRLRTGSMCQRIWEAASHGSAGASVPAPVGNWCLRHCKGSWSSQVTHLGSLGQGQGQLELFVTCRYTLHFRVSCFPTINKEIPHPHTFGTGRQHAAYVWRWCRAGKDQQSVADVHLV